ncbi:hypothetical protein RIF29_21207 [Crotalaria pallida]|uniref:Uncharacterized protein n=1 Tax=Crotalaria pallida TaxID=3830 RepID=A0AAN9I5R3_CROPI
MMEDIPARRVEDMDWATWGLILVRRMEDIPVRRIKDTDWAIWGPHTGEPVKRYPSLLLLDPQSRTHPSFPF